MNRYHMIWLAVALAAPGWAAAAAAEEHGHRQHEAHVHGEARLDVALEGKGLVMQLDSPAVNIVGFEHPPSLPEESSAIERATRLLNDGAALFVPAPEAKCRLASAKVTSEGMDPGAPAEAEADHAEADHEDADHEEGHHHAEFQAEYHFDCGAPERMNSLEVRLFGPFPGTHKVHVQLVTPKVQAAADLTPDAMRMNF